MHNFLGILRIICVCLVFPLLQVEAGNPYGGVGGFGGPPPSHWEQTGAGGQWPVPNWPAPPPGQPGMQYPQPVLPVLPQQSCYVYPCDPGTPSTAAPTTSAVETTTTATTASSTTTSGGTSSSTTSVSSTTQPPSSSSTSTTSSSSTSPPTSTATSSTTSASPTTTAASPTTTATVTAVTGGAGQGQNASDSSSTQAASSSTTSSGSSSTMATATASASAVSSTGATSSSTAITTTSAATSQATSSAQTTSTGASSVGGLGLEQQTLVLNTHNDLRASLANGTAKNQTGTMPSGTNLRQFAYNTSLETTAQTWAKQCTFQHSNDSMRQGAGENLYWDSNLTIAQSDVLVGACNFWWKELVDHGIQASLNLTQTEFNKGIGHWTQMAWSSTSSVGCATNVCSNATYVVCHYSPPGNFINQLVYTPGTKCADCASNYGSSASCNSTNGLCVLS